MGYDTKFRGFFKVTPELTRADEAALLKITSIRHSVEEDEYPSLYCQWTASRESIKTVDGLAERLVAVIAWDGKEKFYAWHEWLDFLIENFFEPKGYALDGTVYWRGETFDDVGKITVTANQISLEYLLPSTTSYRKALPTYGAPIK